MKICFMQFPKHSITFPPLPYSQKFSAYMRHAVETSDDSLWQIFLLSKFICYIIEDVKIVNVVA
jgi:hypothetical protein